MIFIQYWLKQQIYQDHKKLIEIAKPSSQLNGILNVFSYFAFLLLIWFINLEQILKNKIFPVNMITTLFMLTTSSCSCVIISINGGSYSFIDFYIQFIKKVNLLSIVKNSMLYLTK
jgi:hypothetical protein